MRFFISALILSMSFSINAALKNKVDGEVVNLSGKVTSVSPESFTLKVKDDKILVEMDEKDEVKANFIRELEQVAAE